MRKYTLLFILALVPAMTFAQGFDTNNNGYMANSPQQYYSISGEVQQQMGVQQVVNVQEEYSGNVQLNIPYDYSIANDEMIHTNVANDYKFPQYSLSDATKVKTGPEHLIIAFIVLLSVYSLYYFKYQKSHK